MHVVSVAMDKHMDSHDCGSSIEMAMIEIHLRKIRELNIIYTGERGNENRIAYKLHELDATGNGKSYRRACHVCCVYMCVSCVVLCCVYVH